MNWETQRALQKVSESKHHLWKYHTGVWAAEHLWVPESTFGSLKAPLAPGGDLWVTEEDFCTSGEHLWSLKRIFGSLEIYFHRNYSY